MTGSVVVDWLLVAALLTGAPAPASPPAPTEVTVGASRGGLLVEVSHAQAAREHALGSGSAQLQKSGWSLRNDGQGARLEAGTVTADKPFDRYRLEIPADKEAVDRVYAAHVSIGGCGAMLRPGAFTADGPINVRFADQDGLRVVAPGGAVTEAGATTVASAGARYFFLGRDDCIHRDAGTVWLYDPQRLPPAVVELVRKGLPQAVSRLKTRLATPLEVEPVIAVDFIARESGFSFRGDVDEAGTLLLRLVGPDAGSMEGELAGQLEAFLLHEVFHLWNGVEFSQADDNTRAWLSEGAAEYAAQKLQRELGHLDDAAFLRGMEDRLNRCVGVLGQKTGGIDARDREGGSLVYDCGTVIQWLGDHLVAKDGDFFTVWRALFADAAEPGGKSTYAADDYVERLVAASPDARALATLRWFIAGDAPAGRPSLVEGLGAAGIRVVVEADTKRDPEAIQAVLMHLLAGSCEGRFGYTTEPGFLLLDTDDRCGALSGNPPVSQINGLRIGEQDREAHRSARQSCRERGHVTLSHEDRALEVPCRRPLNDLSPRLRVMADRFSPGD